MLAKYICSYLVTTLVSSEEAQNPTGTQSRIELHAIFLTDELTEKNQMNELFQNKKEGMRIMKRDPSGRWLSGSSLCQKSRICFTPL